MVRTYVARALENARVGLLMASGVLAAAQIGKTIISIPLIRAEMGIGLDLAGLIVGIFAALGATFGIGAGVLVQSIGARRSLAGGMTCIAIGNLIGSAAPSEWYLLFGRFTEGVGFLAIRHCPLHNGQGRPTAGALVRRRHDNRSPALLHGLGPRILCFLLPNLLD